MKMKTLAFSLALFFFFVNQHPALFPIAAASLCRNRLYLQCDLFRLRRPLLRPSLGAPARPPVNAPFFLFVFCLSNSR